MQMRSIGSLSVSAIGLGCNNFGRRLDAAGTAEVLDAALDAGITFLDTAEVYGDGDSEAFLGRALRGRREQSWWPRSSAGPTWARAALRPERIEASLEGSLRRLRIDHVDLYQLHHPDRSVPIADTLGALANLDGAGLVREIGCSNFSAAQLEEAATAAAEAGLPRFVSVQNEYSLLHREPEAEVLPACDRLELAFLPYFPLMNGLLTGKYRRGRPLPEGARITTRKTELASDDNLERVERLIAFRRGAQLRAARPGLRLLARARARGERDRRRDLGRAGAAQRGRRPLGAHGRRPARGREAARHARGRRAAGSAHPGGDDGGSDDGSDDA
jgi:aryl-alcohol dehydrogenase-like predicted oxidoreductase